jgi:hypothetical protein
MNLTGSRKTLIANVCALIVASALVIEGHYIVQERLGITRPIDFWGPFVPAFAMFVIRNRIFSFCFLFLYIALSIQMFVQARSIYFGTYTYAGAKEPLGYMGLFFFVSIYSLAIYAVGSLVWFAISRLMSRR